MNNLPKKGYKLFLENGDHYQFSHFAWGNREDQFYGYINGYKESADYIMQNALDKKEISILDTCIFPACFLYRQFIELALKDIYLSFSKDNKQEKIKTLEKASHDLEIMWNKVKPIILEYFPNDDEDTLDAVEDYIKQFIQEDKNSFAFRYPITKRMELIHQKERRINLNNLALRMNELESFFSAVSMGIGSMKEYEDEMRSYYEADMQGYY